MSETIVYQALRAPPRPLSNSAVIPRGSPLDLSQDNHFGHTRAHAPEVVFRRGIEALKPPDMGGFELKAEPKLNKEAIALEEADSISAVRDEIAQIANAPNHIDSSVISEVVLSTAAEALFIVPGAGIATEMVNAVAEETVVSALEKPDTSLKEVGKRIGFRAAVLIGLKLAGYLAVVGI